MNEKMMETNQWWDEETQAYSVTIDSRSFENQADYKAMVDKFSSIAPQMKVSKREIEGHELCTVTMEPMSFPEKADYDACLEEMRRLYKETA